MNSNSILKDECKFASLTWKREKAGVMEILVSLITRAKIKKSGNTHQ